MESYTAAVNDPNNELIHLFEVRDSLSKEFGGKKAAISALNISTKELQELGFEIVATEGGRQYNLFKTEFASKTGLIIGSEGTGVRKNLKKLADKTISIPQFGFVNSLNASVSAAVIIYEIVRQKSFNG